MVDCRDGNSRRDGDRLGLQGGEIEYEWRGYLYKRMRVLSPLLNFDFSNSRTE